ncbi:MAG: 4Fe-4S binding protein [Candidatus Bathyarchaeota archaeon]|nr:MAG: 4Fe-4S binding protein [Candidatus Bathyarchaeota archaeon]
MAEAMYHELAKAYGSPNSKYLPRIFEICLSKTDAAVLLSLPGTPDEIAPKVSVEAVKVAEILKDLFNKGFVLYKPVDDKLRYGLNGDLWDSILPDRRDFEKFGEEFLDLWRSYHEEKMMVSPDEQYSENYTRVIPVEKTIPMKWGEILPYERISEVFEDAKTIAVTECACRTMSRRCDYPTDVCLLFNEFADIFIERGIARRIPKEEALSIVKRCEDLGLIHQLNNTEPEGYQFLCNCCSCCCSILRGMISFGKEGITAKSRYISSIDSELCDGCGLCTTRCQFGAATTVDSKAIVDKDKCFGCGLCAPACPTNAIQLVPVRGPEHVIDNLEKAPAQLVDTLIIE